MLDVHPAHHAATTWRDFFIHIATIVLGLLIAVGLEQTVEFFHHRHQRHVLEEALRAESETNLANTEVNIEQFSAEQKYLLALRTDIDTMLATDGKAHLTFRVYTAPPRGHRLAGAGNLLLVTSTWESATADGRLVLLPDDLQRSYQALYLQLGRLLAAMTALTDLRAKEYTAFLAQFSANATPFMPDLSRMDRAQLLELRRLVLERFALLQEAKRRSRFADGDLHRVLSGGSGDTAKILQTEEAAAAAHPDDFPKMAEEIEAERTKDGK
jgi:hypothetical protein